eukprot:136536_1
MAASTSSTSNVPVLEFIPPFANPIDNVQSEQSNINNNHVGKYCILLRDVTLEEDNEMEIVIGTGQLGQIIIENQTIKVAFTKPHDCRKAILQKGDICIDKAKVKQAAMKVSKLYGLIEDYPFTDGAKRKIKKHRENIKKRRGMAKKQKTDIEYSDDETNETAPVQANLSLPSLNDPIIAETAPVQANLSLPSLNDGIIAGDDNDDPDIAPFVCAKCQAVNQPPVFGYCKSCNYVTDQNDTMNWTCSCGCVNARTFIWCTDCSVAKDNVVYVDPGDTTLDDTIPEEDKEEEKDVTVMDTCQQNENVNETVNEDIDKENVEPITKFRWNDAKRKTFFELCVKYKVLTCSVIKREEQMQKIQTQLICRNKNIWCDISTEKLRKELYEKQRSIVKHHQGNKSDKDLKGPMLYLKNHCAKIGCLKAPVLLANTTAAQLKKKLEKERLMKQRIKDAEAFKKRKVENERKKEERLQHQSDFFKAGTKSKKVMTQVARQQLSSESNKVIGNGISLIVIHWPNAKKCDGVDWTKQECIALVSSITNTDHPLYVDVERLVYGLKHAPSFATLCIFIKLMYNKSKSIQ